MHMHCHLRNCLFDYGPVYSFWCFSYERYNDILGNQPSNNRDIEPQLMMRFLGDNAAYSLASPSYFQEDFSSVCLPSPRLVGSLLQGTAPERNSIEIPKNYVRTLLDSQDKIPIIDVLAKLEQCQGRDIEVYSVARKYTAITVNAKRLSTSRNQSCVMLEWDRELLGESCHPASFTGHGIIRPAKIVHFLQVTYTYPHCSKDTRILLAHVSWFLTHPDCCVFGKPAQVWGNNIYESTGYVPVSLYRSQCVQCILSHNGEKLLVIVPLVN